MLPGWVLVYPPRPKRTSLSVGSTVWDSSMTRFLRFLLDLDLTDDAGDFVVVVIVDDFCVVIVGEEVVLVLVPAVEMKLSVTAPDEDASDAVEKTDALTIESASCVA